MPPKTWPTFLLHCIPCSIPWSFVSLRLATDRNEVSSNPTSWLSQRVARDPFSFHNNCSGKTQGITYKGRNKILTILVPNSLAGTVTETSLGISALSLSPWEVIPKYFPWLWHGPEDNNPYFWQHPVWETSIPMGLCLPKIVG